jgi:hypothetical protein
VRILPRTIFILLCMASLGVQSAPRLNFSDLISGPSTGIGDGLGSGVIVTLWGQNLSNQQGESAVVFTDVDGTEYSSPHVYYWKNSDGTLPGGAANLFVSHGMQEIAISVPQAPNGLGSIHVVVNNQVSNKLPFTVRDGLIYHVKSSGDDLNSGIFSSPYLTIPGALSKVNEPGSTVYIHDSIINAPDVSTVRFSVYWNNGNASSGSVNQFGLIAYPNSQPEVIGNNGFTNFKAQGLVVSKFHVKASNCDESATGQPINCRTVARGTSGIQGSAYGRIIANAITDAPGGCANSERGAITGSRLSVEDDAISGIQIFGNEIYEYGCPGTSKFHHTTYMSIRNRDNPLIDAWRFGWNFLHDNHAKNGIHNYDQKIGGGPCGSPIGTIHINDNVIVNQSGAGINTGASCAWANEFKIYNNLLINVGLASSWNGIDSSTSFQGNTGAITVDDNFGLESTFDIFNNTIVNWNKDSVVTGSRSCFGLINGGSTARVAWNANVCISDVDRPFVEIGNDVQLLKPLSKNNNWFYSGTSPVLSVAPTWDNGNILDPKVSVQSFRISVAPNSPIDGINTPKTNYDLYGNLRGTNGTIGAVEYVTKPSAPTAFQIQ